MPICPWVLLSVLWLFKSVTVWQLPICPWVLWLVSWMTMHDSFGYALMQLQRIHRRSAEFGVYFQVSKRRLLVNNGLTEESETSAVKGQQSTSVNQRSTVSSTVKIITSSTGSRQHIGYNTGTDEMPVMGQWNSKTSGSIVYADISECLDVLDKGVDETDNRTQYSAKASLQIQLHLLSRKSLPLFS